jgi:hypothetical protein
LFLFTFTLKGKGWTRAAPWEAFALNTDCRLPGDDRREPQEGKSAGDDRPAAAQGAGQLQEVLPHVEGRRDHGHRLCQVDRCIAADAVWICTGF